MLCHPSSSKKCSMRELNEYRPVALTSTVMKIFERLVWIFRTAERTVATNMSPMDIAQVRRIEKISADS